MGTHGFRKGGGNRVAKEDEIGIQGKTRCTPPGKAMFIMRKIRA